MRINHYSIDLAKDGMKRHPHDQKSYLINEVEKLGNVIGYGRAVGIQPFQMLFKNLEERLQCRR